MGRLANLLDALTDEIRGGARTSPVPAIPAGSGDWGHEQGEFAPPEYGSYIATSNDVYSAAMLRARSLAKLSLEYFDAPDGMGENVEGGGDVGKLLRHVNPHWTWRRLVVMYEMSMAIWGQSYLFTERASPTSPPSELWWAKPTLVKPVLDRENYIKRFDYTPPGATAKISFDPAEVVWFRYPNIIDEFTGLAPMAAVRLAADVASSSLKANRALFDQGFVQAGIIGPPADMDFTQPQADDLEAALSKRFQGGDKAHRWAVMRYDFQTKELGVTPKDAMFIEQMNLTFRQVCRGMGVPPALLADSEYATLSNLSIYERQLWDGLMEFEANFMTDEMNEQLLPMFKNAVGGVQSIKFDFSNISALQEDKTIKEQRDAAQIADGRKTINEWRIENGYDPVDWGDVFWASWNVVPVVDGDVEDTATPKEPVAEEDEEEERTVTRANDRETKFDDEEAKLAAALRKVMASIFDAAQRELRQGRTADPDVLRDIESAANNPFDVLRYIVAFRKAGRGSLTTIIKKAFLIGGHQAGGDVTNLLDDPRLVAEAERLVDKMADTVARNLWNEMRESLNEGILNGEDLDAMTARVKNVVGPDAAEYRARRIAQTETTRAVTDGKLTAWDELGVKEKRWVSQGDANVRETHRAANGTVVGLGEEFVVGACVGPGPGRMGCTEEDINCRCDLEPVKTAAALVASALVAVRDSMEARA